ncbi:MAG: hypothetical protein JRI68_23255 [Deltaproteobacteria bacterium]|nr:hypothetical protein [Deltaproteobacteria bacterium]
MRAQPTPKDVVFKDGIAELLHFRPKPGVERSAARPLLLVPSIINRWYVLDLFEGSSVVEALVAAGIDTYCLEWGVAGDEDRYFEWDDILQRLGRAVRATKRLSGSPQLGMLGYCVGGTLAAIHTALDPKSVAALVNLAGPIDFSKGGTLTELVDPRWFDAEAIASAGNIAPAARPRDPRTHRSAGGLGQRQRALPGRRLRPVHQGSLSRQHARPGRAPHPWSTG